MVARGKGVCDMSEMEEGGQEVQTSNHKINKSWGYNVHHGD